MDPFFIIGGGMFLLWILSRSGGVTTPDSGVQTAPPTSQSQTDPNTGDPVFTVTVPSEVKQSLLGSVLGYLGITNAQWLEFVTLYGALGAFVLTFGKKFFEVLSNGGIFTHLSVESVQMTQGFKDSRKAVLELWKTAYPERVTIQSFHWIERARVPRYLVGMPSFGLTPDLKTLYSMMLYYNSKIVSNPSNFKKIDDLFEWIIYFEKIYEEFIEPDRTYFKELFTDSIVHYYLTNGRTAPDPLTVPAGAESSYWAQFQTAIRDKLVELGKI